MVLTVDQVLELVRGAIAGQQESQPRSRVLRLLNQFHAEATPYLGVSVSLPVQREMSAAGKEALKNSPTVRPSRPRNTEVTPEPVRVTESAADKPNIVFNKENE